MTLPVRDEGSEAGDPENEPAYIRRTGFFFPDGIREVIERPKKTAVIKKPRIACLNCLRIT